MSNTTATAERLLSPRRSDRSDGSSSEARDVLPSLPSSSSSLMFINGTYKHPSSVDGARRRQRVPSLYGSTSTGTSDTNPIRGSSTFEYDVDSNLHRQQSRRQRGDSNASISTVASAMSRSKSIADSFTSSIAAYEHDGHVRGQFVGTSGAGNDQGSIRSGFSSNLHSGGAAASLRRIGGRSSTRGVGGRNGAAGGAQTEGHLNDRLESLIANSASYRAAGGHTQSSARMPLSESTDINGAKRPAFDGRQRKSSFASIRSLIGYSSSGTQRQSSTGAYESTISRTASLFGVYMGGSNGFPSSSSGLSRTLRSPAWAQPSRPSAPTLTTANGEKVVTAGRGDALGTLKGIRGRYDLPTVAPSGRRNNVRDIFPADQSTTSHGQPASNTTSPPHSPTQSGPSGQRQLSMQAKLRKRAAQNAVPSATTSARRAFAALDPTSSSNHASGSATPRSVRSVTPPTISRTSSQVDLPMATNGGSGQATPSSPTHSHDPTKTVSGAMPALDAALARAEDKSGLKTSSRCTACNKRAVNAPVSRNGDVFCSRECRIETKRKRQAAAKAIPDSATSSTSTVPNNPATAAIHSDTTSIASAPSPVILPSEVRSPSVAAPV